ncbi:MAG: serine hydrolase [Haliscomenobacter sp.]|nr:serine hydrolase [Haliscomenobacter sp.]
MRYKIQIGIIAGAGVFLLLIALLLSRRAPDKAVIPYLNGGSRWPDSLQQALSRQQKLAQLLIYEPKLAHPVEEDSLKAHVHDGYLGGASLQGLNLLHYLFLMDTLQRSGPLPLFFFSRHPVLHNNLFSDVPELPSAASMAMIPKGTAQSGLTRLYANQALALGLNLTVPFHLDAPWRDSSSQTALIKLLHANRIVPGAAGFTEFYPEQPDTASWVRRRLAPTQQLVNQGLGVFLLERKLPGTDTLTQYPRQFFKKYLSNYLGYNGLLIGRISPETPLPYLLHAGVDLFLTSEEPQDALSQLETALENGDWNRQDFRKSFQKAMLVKQWMYGSRTAKDPIAFYRPIQASLPAKQKPAFRQWALDAIWDHFKETNWAQFSYGLREKAIVVANNPGKTLPWKDLETHRFFWWTNGRYDYPVFRRLFQHYAEIQAVTDPDSLLAMPSGTATPVLVVLANPTDAGSLPDSLYWHNLKRWNREIPVVLVHFGPMAPGAVQDSSLAVIQSFELHEQNESLAAQLFFGGIASSGIRPGRMSSPFPRTEQPATPKWRIAYSPPERTGIAPEKLVAIDAIARQAIAQKLLPGCQIAIAKNGRMIYSKAFGKPAYSSEFEVHTQDLYDIASLTKISSTTLLAMQLVEEEKVGLGDRLYDHLSWLRGTAIGKVTLLQLLTHQSGLPASIPVAKYIKARKYSRRACDLYFCNRKRGSYTVQVADKLFFNRRYLSEIRREVSRIKPKRKRTYQYSDLNFWLLQQVIEAKTGKRLDQQSAQKLYRPLGLRRIAFNPLEKFPSSDLIPTENEMIWRRQLIHGYVHDPAAAILGGVSGHAGLFSNAENLAVLMQLLLNEGSYGGNLYYQPQTVADFTQRTYGNHRGLGFDHPSYENRNSRVKGAGSELFGHTGFTGTCIWVDPKEELIYVFLANRVHPNTDNKQFITQNIRGRIHQVIYDGLNSYAPSLPEL